jgi:RHS repeat-associated protein
VIDGRQVDEIHKPVVFDGGTAPPFFVYDSSVQRTEHLLGQPPYLDVTTSFGMHPSGSPLSITSSSTDNYVDSVVLAYGAEDTVNWHIGRVTRRTETSKVPAGTSETRTTSFEYEPDGGRLWATVTEPDDYTGAPSASDPSLKLRTELLREPDAGLGTGQVTSIRQVPGDDAGIRITSITYDRLDAIFPAVVVNPASMQTDYSWDRARGLQLGETDPNNISIKRDYDPRGRLRSETVVDSTGTLTGQERHRHYLASTDGGTLITEVSFDAGVKTRADIFGRTIQRETIGFDGGTVLEDFAYDARGFLVSETAPHAAASAGPLVQYVYDNSGRLGTTTWPDGTTSKVTYSGLVASFTNQKGALEGTLTKNQLGDVVNSTERLAGFSLTTSFTIKPFHAVSSIQYPGTTEKPNVSITRDLDLRGRLRGSDDPDSKATSARYNSFGELVSVTRPDGSTSYVRDPLGRAKKIIRSVDGTTTLAWDTVTNGIGQLGSATGTTGIVTSYTYDGVGRRASVKRTLPATALFAAASYTFDVQYEKGRLKHVTYPSVPNGTTRFAVTYGYTPEGRLKTISEDDSLTAPLWTASSMDERENVTNATFGSAYGTILRRFDVMNQLRFIESTGPTSNPVKLQKLAYEYDVVGELTWRHDLVARTSEEFVHDDLHRISSWRVDQNCLSSFNVTWGYDDSGNMRIRAGSLGIVTYRYEGAGAHALTSSSAGDVFSYDSSGNQTSGPGYSIPATNQWGLPKQLRAGTLIWAYEYEASGRRVRKSRDAQNAVVDIDGLYQQIISNGAVEHRFVVPAPDGTIVQVPWSSASGTVSRLDPLFLLAERLGSVETIASKTGQVLARRKYDPFGIPLAPEDLRAPRDPSAISAFGFTAQTFDPESRLHDFGGRIYDPRFGRFLSPDPHVPQPLSSQSYGRYAYARNAPTRRTDPTGRCDDDGLCIEGSTDAPYTPIGGPPIPPLQGPPTNLYPCPGCYPVWFDTTPNRQAPSVPARTDSTGTRGGPYTINDVRQSVGREPTVGDVFTGDKARTRSILDSDHELTENASLACFPNNCTFEFEDAVREANSEINQRMVRELLPMLLGNLSLTPATGVTRALLAPKPYNVWALDPMTRGRIIHRALGESLPDGFKTIDRFSDGLALSIKSLDLNAKTYQNVLNLKDKLWRYIDSVASFTGAQKSGVRITAEDIRGRALQVVVPPGATRAQQQVLQEAVEYGRSVGVEVTIVPFR